MATRTGLPTGWNARFPAGTSTIAVAPRRRRGWVRWTTGVGIAVGVVAILFAGTGYVYSTVPEGGLSESDEALTPRPDQVETARRLRRKLTGLTVGKNYVVVDQANNRLYLRRGEELLHEAICSSGSGYVLREGEERGDKARTWVFDSPRGEFKVRSKIDKPVWKKPDWAFVEVGEPIPKNPSERLEYGVLGDHALYLGDGYMIHGTLYERLLGRSVTHGCVRLGRDDLKRIYEASPIGTQVFIY